MHIECKNCGFCFEGKYCSQCGQSAETKDISFSYLWHEIHSGLLHLDRGMLFTTKNLFIRPGHFIREYIEGKRIQHFKPLVYIFVLATVYAVVGFIWPGVSNYATFSVTLPGERTEQLSGFYYNAYNTLVWVMGHYAYSILLSLPLFSLASWIAFRRQGYNYVQHNVINAYLAGQRTIVFLVFFPILAVVTQESFKEIVYVLRFFVTNALFILGYIQLFSPLSPWKVFSRLILMILLLVFIALSLIFLFAAIFS